MGNKKSLLEARKNKNDEFYTQLEDIIAEMVHYKQHFKGKTILMNCDDPKWSNFWKYFHMNFSAFGIKKLISTHYDKNETTYKMEYTGGDDNDIEVGVKTDLQQNGDFRSPECVELLKESDIVVTNPPFSLFREYVAQLMKYNKKFIIIGNKNAITYKEFFPLLKDNKVWIGYNNVYNFIQPDGSIKKIVNSGWFTNFDIKKQQEWIETTYLYSKKDDLYPDLYPKYDNYDAINVDKMSEIPMDYDGVMGVPITFMDKYNPEQFEIVGLGKSRDNFTPNKDYINPKRHSKDGKIKNGSAVNYALVIEQDTAPIGTVYYTSDNSKYLVSPYARILIRKKI